MNISRQDIKGSGSIQRIMPLVIFLLAAIFLFSWERAVKPLPQDGLRFQQWSSDDMWQNMNSHSLREHPFKTLLYLHKQPPLFDAIRAVLVFDLQGLSEKEVLDRLDRRIYVLWGVAFALMAALIYHWLSQLTDGRYAFYASVAWILHPAPIFYATYLDPTFLISLVILWFFYEMWRLSINRGSITRVAIAAVLLFYLRGSFQWHFFLLSAFCLWLMHLPLKKILKFAVISVLLVAPLVIKQSVLFNISGTTFLGRHWFFLVAGDDPSVKDLRAVAALVPGQYPKDAVLSVGKFNTEQDWRNNQAYYVLARRYVREHPWKVLENVARTFFVYNWRDYWRPSASFDWNSAVTALPWYQLLNQSLSYPVHFLLLVVAFLLWVKSRQDAGLYLFNRPALGVFLVVFYVFLTSTLVNGDGKGWTEAVRYKFFLEPVFYVFVTSQFYILFTGSWKSTRTS